MFTGAAPLYPKVAMSFLHRLINDDIDSIAVEWLILTTAALTMCMVLLTVFHGGVAVAEDDVGIILSDGDKPDV